MNMLEKKQHYSLLFDFYEGLLTEKQQQYFKAYYFEDLSLAEIALFYKVSRNAVYDQIKKTHDILEKYESILGLYKKYCLRNKCYDDFDTSKIDAKSLIEKLKELE